MNAEDINYVSAICRCALAASPDSLALKHQVNRLIKHYDATNRPVPATKLRKILFRAENPISEPLLKPSLPSKWDEVILPEDTAA